MLIYPAIDLMGGQCVRLVQGRFDEATFYSADPAETLAGFAGAGAAWAHIVDLDGARSGRPEQHDFIASLARQSPVKLQVGGGVRSRDQIARLLDAGVGRVVVGSVAVNDPDLVRRVLAEFGPERITLALDVRFTSGVPLVTTKGWTETAKMTIADVLGLVPAARHLLVTDIDRDGMLGGPNLGLVESLVQDLPDIELQASGGVATIQDVRSLAALGSAGAIIGKALWEGRIDLAEAIRDAGR